MTTIEIVYTRKPYVFPAKVEILQVGGFESMSQAKADDFAKNWCAESGKDFVRARVIKG